MSGPLEGLKVVELAGIGPSPYACMLLADLGADVLRLERGDADADHETTWDLLNRSRPSVAVDLKNDAGRDLVLELCEQADVLIEGFVRASPNDSDSDPRTSRARNPRLVYGRMTGYGQDGPIAAARGSRHQLHRGLGSAVADRSSQVSGPCRRSISSVTSAVDRCSWSSVSSPRSSRRGAPARVRWSTPRWSTDPRRCMAMTHAFLNAGFWHEERGTNLLDTGAPFYEVYETETDSSSRWAPSRRSSTRNCCDGLGLDGADAASTDRTASAWPEMKERFAARSSRRRTRDEWTEIFADVDACVTPVLSPREAARHPYNTARDVFSTGRRHSAAAGAAILQDARRDWSRRRGKPVRGRARACASWGIDVERQVALRAAGAFG